MQNAANCDEQTDVFQSVMQKGYMSCTEQIAIA